jgi:hypothetical protein
MPHRDSIHVRLPESWRSQKIRASRVRYLLDEFSKGRFELLGEDPGWGKYEVSFRVRSRQELNATARRAGLPAATLMRRLVARDLDQERPIQTSSPLAQALSMLLPTPATSVRTQPWKRESGTIQEDTPTAIIGQTRRIRSIEEIERALIGGDPISGEEQLRWRAAQKFKRSAYL